MEKFGRTTVSNILLKYALVILAARSVLCSLNDEHRRINETRVTCVHVCVLVCAASSSPWLWAHFGLAVFIYLVGFVLMRVYSTSTSAVDERTSSVHYTTLHFTSLHVHVHIHYCTLLCTTLHAALACGSILLSRLNSTLHSISRESRLCVTASSRASDTQSHRSCANRKLMGLSSPSRAEFYYNCNACACGSILLAMTDSGARVTASSALPSTLQTRQRVAMSGGMRKLVCTGRVQYFSHCSCVEVVHADGRRHSAAQRSEANYLPAFLVRVDLVPSTISGCLLHLHSLETVERCSRLFVARLLQGGVSGVCDHECGARARRGPPDAARRGSRAIARRARLLPAALGARARSRAARQRRRYRRVCADPSGHAARREHVERRGGTRLVLDGRRRAASAHLPVPLLVALPVRLTHVLLLPCVLLLLQAGLSDITLSST